MIRILDNNKNIRKNIKLNMKIKILSNKIIKFNQNNNRKINQIKDILNRKINNHQRK